MNFPLFLLAYLFFSFAGPAENQGFHVNAGAYPGQSAGVPGSGPGSQQIRALQIHSSGTLPPPPQQPHPQPPPTPTSTPPASDMGKATQIQPSMYFVVFYYYNSKCY